MTILPNKASAKLLAVAKAGGQIYPSSIAGQSPIRALTIHSLGFNVHVLRTALERTFLQLTAIQRFSNFIIASDLRNVGSCIGAVTRCCFESCSYARSSEAMSSMRRFSSACGSLFGVEKYTDILTDYCIDAFGSIC